MICPHIMYKFVINFKYLLRYEGMIEYEPTFPAPYKRKVAILKAQNKTSEAVNDLNRYLNTFR